MKTFVGVDALSAPPDGSVVTIGTFDGVHTGHRALVARTIAEARARGVAAAVITWDRHPAATLRPDAVPLLLTTPERKVELLGDTGIDLLAVLPFDRELSQWPPERFVEKVLVAGLGARAVFVGKGWRFGHKARGDVATLERISADLGFEAEALTLEDLDGEPVSSSRIRMTLAAGDLSAARAMLGRPFDLDGVVVRGAVRGRELGFPTANIAPDPALALPPRGVYAGRARVGESWFGAAINLGVNPTFGGDPERSPLRVEAYLLDFEGDLYGQILRVEFWERLRDELAFASVDDLVAQMGRDVEATRELLEA